MNGSRPFIVLGVAAMILLALFYYFAKGGESKTFIWKESYESDSKQPYGTFVMHDLLSSATYPVENITQSVKEELPEDPDTLSNYVFVGQSLYLDSLDTQRLLKFVENGNNALISSKTVPYDLMFYILATECSDAYWDDYTRNHKDTLMYLHFDHPDLVDSLGYEYKYINKFEAKSYTWHYVDSIHFCGDTSSLTALGHWRSTSGETNVNFAKIKYGEGTFYLHSSPIVFSNIQMLDERRKNYAMGVLSHLPEGQNYWDAYGQQDEEIGRMRNEQDEEVTASLSGKSPLQYILGQAPLAWAWYTFLGLTGLYLFFRAKRRQRVIPVLHENSNTSLEFVSTIGSLYFQQKKHRGVALKQMQLFLGQMRQKYGVSTKYLDKPFAKQLSQLSEVPIEQVEQLLLVHRNINKSPYISEQTLIDFNRLIEDFYEQCK